MLVLAAKIDSLTEEIADEARGGSDADIFRSNVVLHAGPLIDTQLRFLVHWTTQSPVILPCIDVVRIVFRVINVLFWSITPKSLFSNLELAGTCSLVSNYDQIKRSSSAPTVSEAHETKDPKQESDCIGADILPERDSSDD